MPPPSKISPSAPAPRGVWAISPWNGRSGAIGAAAARDTVQHRTIQARIDEIDRQRSASAGAPEGHWREKVGWAWARCCCWR